MTNYALDYEAVLLAITYVETLITGDAEQHEIISKTVDEPTLIHGLTAVSMIFMEITKNKLNVSREEVLETARVIAFNQLTARENES